MSDILTIATDGSCLKNPGGAIGWSWADSEGRWMHNGYIRGTNQSAELLALLSALIAFPNHHLKLELDSQYTLNIATKWMFSWQRNSWRRKDGEISNLEIVKALYDQIALRNQKKLVTEMVWVKGHKTDGSHPLNVVADEKCGLAARLASKGQDSYLDSSGNTTSKRQEWVLNSFRSYL